jgi:hypothetical protein
MRHLHVPGLALAIAVTGCGKGDGALSDVTYYEHVKPILDARCVTCHFDEGIGPFSLTTYEETSIWAVALPAAVQSGVMPPWPPGPDCNEYQHDRSLDPAEIEVITAWVEQGSPAGDPAAATPSDPPARLLDRVDVTLAMPEPYVAQRTPDDYRCFVLEWPETETKFVTGYDIVPGNSEVVHHVIAFLAPASAKGEYDALEASEAGPGYTCFGATNGTISGVLGTWVPGSLGELYPEGTGIRVAPGSLVILQVHYNVHHGTPAPDLTSMQVRTADTVDKPAFTLPWLNPDWLSGDNMLIPAGDPDVVHRFSFDPTPFLGLIPGSEIPSGSSIMLHSANLHMHNLGTSGVLSLDRQVGGERCLLRIPEWDFHWQGAYSFVEPERLDPGDRLYIECRWNNSADNQPIVDGVRQEPRNVRWGEGTGDEMCLGGLYVTAAD